MGALRSRYSNLGWLIIAACASSNAGGGARTDASSGGGALRAVTFNAGLLDSVGYVKERAPLVIDAVAALDADLVCVQELWDDEHWNAVAKASKARRPHVLRLDPHPGVSGKCSPDEFAPLRSCAQAQCGSAGASDLVSCTTTQCEADVAALSSTCTACLLDNISGGDFDLIAAACLGAGGTAGGVVPPDERAYLVGGSFGLGLLSALPLLETDSLELDASTNRRAILYAKLNDHGLGTLHVFCTHLAPIEKGVKYEGSYGNWEGENAAHVDALIDFAKKKAGAHGKILLLGDLNTGPSHKGVAPSVPDNYAKLPAAGFADPFLNGSTAACTFCTDNPLVSADDAAADADIDHIMTRAIASVPSVKRLFTEPVDITAHVVRLSDHYGLEATFAF